MTEVIYNLYACYDGDSSSRVWFFSTRDIIKLQLALQTLMIPEHILDTIDTCIPSEAVMVQDDTPIPMFWSIEVLELDTRPTVFTERYTKIYEAMEDLVAMGGHEYLVRQKYQLL